MPSPRTVVGIHVTVNNTKTSVCKETQEWVFFALLSSEKLCRPVVNRINVFRSSCKVFPTLLMFGVPRQIFVKFPNIKFNENPSSGRRADTRRQADRHTERHDEASTCFLIFM
jgi:hypothetical protein